jgi:hypothetical protein
MAGNKADTYRLTNTDTGRGFPGVCHRSALMARSAAIVPGRPSLQASAAPRRRLLTTRANPVSQEGIFKAG